MTAAGQQNDDDRDGVLRDFDDVVNMTPGELKKWLDTEESKSVGQSDGGESVGHASGRRIIDLLSARLRQDNPQHSRASPGPVLVGGSARGSRWAPTGARPVADQPNRMSAALHSVP